ncbi:MAG TPA: hypothetical protein VGL39_27730 [Jatrophihabitantaceae bacterium]|jgi:hypothetical protein
MTVLAMDRAYESRCIHDQLEWPTLGKSSCSICLRLPYLVSSMLAEFEPVLAPDEPERELLWLPSELRGECSRCQSPIGVGQPAANMPGPAASVRVVGSCCRDEVA